MNRRSLLQSMTAAGLTLGTGLARGQNESGQPTHFFEPVHFGAKGDGQALDSPAINRAIDACTQSGGGIVYLRPGTYRSGTVVLKSNVTLYLEAGATILGSIDMNDYTRMSGAHTSQLGDANDAHLIFAQGAENVTLCGPGRIDGQGQHFWMPSGRKPLPPEDQWAEVTAHAYAKVPTGRPSPMLEFVGCRWLRIEDVRIENAAGWTMRPINCDNVFIRGISVKNPNYGSNTDGMDITGCQNVLISDCTIDTGDDCICLKSENPYGSEPRLARNIVVTNCMMTTCCNGFKIGTATQGGFENITFSNSVIYNAPGAFKDRVISGIALEIVDGGWIDGVVVTGIRMQRTRTPIFIRLGDRSRPHNYPENGLRGVMIEDVHASEALLASSITGVPGKYVEDVTLSNIRVDNVLPSRPEWAEMRVPEKEKGYPEARMFGMLPASMLYARHAKGITLRDISFRSTESENRSALIFDDVQRVNVSGLLTTPIMGSRPALDFRSCSDVWVRDAAPQRCSAFIAADKDSRNILVSQCDLRAVTSPTDTSAPPSAVTFHGNIDA